MTKKMKVFLLAEREGLASAERQVLEDADMDVTTSILEKDVNKTITMMIEGGCNVVLIKISENHASRWHTLIESIFRQTSLSMIVLTEGNPDEVDYEVYTECYSVYKKDRIFFLQENQNDPETLIVAVDQMFIDITACSSW